MREEVPTERRSRFWAFALGLGAHSVLLLPGLLTMIVPQTKRPASRPGAPLAILALAAIFVLARCGEADRARADSEPPRPAGGDSVAAEPYQTPPGFPLPFTTSVPRGFSIESRVGDDASTVTFAWLAGAGRGDSAFVYLHVLPPTATADGAREIVRTAAERLRVPGDTSELRPVELHRWAQVEYPLRTVGQLTGRPVRGWAALGLHAGRWFYVISQAPDGVARTFEPRVEGILEGWRWIGGNGETATIPLDPTG